MSVRLKIAKLLLILPAISLMAGCVTIYNPATERKEMLLFGTSQEVALGADMNEQMKRKIKILDNPEMQSRLNRIGAKVGGASDRQDLVYHFSIVKDKEFNAFAIPGGFIYVNSGLMDASTDDELACVLAHEIGHIAARHSVKRLQTTLGYQLIMSIALGGTSGGQATASAIDVVFNLVDLGYGRKDELLADKLAVKYSKKAGFDPHAMITFFQKLQKEEEKAGGGFNLVFLSSHPPLEERIKNVEKEIAAGKL